MWSWKGNNLNVYNHNTLNTEKCDGEEGSRGGGGEGGCGNRRLRWGLALSSSWPLRLALVELQTFFLVHLLGKSGIEGVGGIFGTGALVSWAACFQLKPLACGPQCKMSV